MKKALLVVSLLGLGLAMLLISVWQVRAEEEVEEVLGDQVTIEQTDVKTSLLEQEVHYYLPYPGVLPDHPVYWLKMLRDRLMEKVTTNPQKRVELLLLYADKRLGAAKFLVEGGQVSLGLETAIKSSGYLGQVVTGVEELKKRGEDVGDIANRLERGTLKHAQVLDLLAKETEGEVRGRFEGYSSEALKMRDRVLVVLGR